ncbi:MAG: 1,4-dihydroxy-6-naphthoate synthase [Planctomycetota bacterium]
MRDLAFGFSPCPNDTFAFWAAVHGRVSEGGIRLVPVLRDIEELNARAVEDRDPLPVTKLSIPALARVADRYAVLPAGAALGYGCGPLIVVRAGDRAGSPADLRGRRLAIPGRHTTAFLLFEILCGVPCDVAPMRFDRIVPAVAAGEADAGLLIHESRFTHERRGLRALADLGRLWERATDGPLPLAVIAVRADVPRKDQRALARTIRRSVETALADPALAREYVRANAREMDEGVCEKHIRLYVNEFSVDLGSRGRSAVEEMLRRAGDLASLRGAPPSFVERN